jgi:chromosome segregation ATPase
MDDELLHNYDAIKRREYYLRTRKLKGRKKGAVRPKAPPKKTRAQRQAERRKKQEAQIAALKGRLEKLRAVLKQLTEAAQKRSGVETKKADPTKSASQQKSSGKTEKLTAAQKAAKAKADKKRREKLDTPEAQIKSLNEKIKTIQERIAKMRKDGSVGARRNTSK